MQKQKEMQNLPPTLPAASTAGWAYHHATTLHCGNHFPYTHGLICKLIKQLLQLTIRFSAKSYHTSCLVYYCHPIYLFSSHYYCHPIYLSSMEPELNSYEPINRFQTTVKLVLKAACIKQTPVFNSRFFRSK